MVSSLRKSSILRYLLRLTRLHVWCWIRYYLHLSFFLQVSSCQRLYLRAIRTDYLRSLLLWRISFFIILWPISRFATFLARVLLRLVGVKIDEEENDGTFTKVDLDHLVQSTIENAKNEDDIEDEVKIFQNALDFQDTKVRDCMVPRTEIKAVEESCSLEELQQMFIESGNSKIICLRRRY